MQRKPIVAGNWKMNKTIGEALHLVDSMLPELERVRDVERVICPPYTALPILANRLAGSEISLGAQNVFWESEGAYTGEISPLMLKDFCRYVIVGHSERRAYFGETDETVNKRLEAVLGHEMTPILCVGETLEENEAGQTAAVVQRQVRIALSGIQLGKDRAIVIAYEPVWAIGTGRAATADGANEVAKTCIRSTLHEILGETMARRTRILYGGSVKPNNAQEFFSQSDIDGALVGGASLKVSDFIAIVQAARH
jgi:triosephosphate isomerase